MRAVLATDPTWWRTATFDGHPMPEFLRARDIGAVFRFLRSRGWSRAAIAAATGLTETRVRAVAQGRQRIISVEVLDRIADGLGIDRGLVGLAFTGAEPSPDLTDHRPLAGLDDRELTQRWGELLTVVAGQSNERGAAAVWELTRRQLVLVDAHRRLLPGGGELLAVQARWSEFASWVADNLGRHAEATRWTELAFSQATEAGDGRTAGYVLMRQAQQAAEHGDGLTAVDLADKARRLAPDRPRTAALCLVRQAHGHALTRDGRAARGALAEAVRLLDHTDEMDQDPLDSHCTNLYVTAYEGRCRLLLGDPDGAARALTEVLAGWPDGLRQDEVLWRTWLADANARAGRKAEAGAEGLRALELVQMTGSARARRVLGDIAGALAGDDRVVEVGQFLAAHRVATAAWRR